LLVVLSDPCCRVAMVAALKLQSVEIKENPCGELL
jgi:hypothetical protein